QPLLSGAVLGTGTCGADRGPRAAGPLRSAGENPDRKRGRHRRGTQQYPGQGRGYRWLLSLQPRTDQPGHASKPDLQRGTGCDGLTPAKVRAWNSRNPGPVPGFLLMAPTMNHINQNTSESI